jgi:RNA polymerase sigma factor (sigma-70 family)
MSQRQKHTKVDESFKAKFLGDVSFLLEKSNPGGRAFLNYLQRTGKQLNIQNLEPHELISEATMRGLAYINDTSKGINNTKAWLRKTCNYIMLDMVKGEKKNRLLKAKNKDPEQEDNPFYEVELDEQKEFLRSVLSFLSKEDQEIIGLKFYKGLSYKDIQQYYMESESKSIKVTALRQRESRALQRLRKQFSEKYGENILV